MKTYSIPRTILPTLLYSIVATRVTTEPIDLSNTRRRPDKETRNCFRYYKSRYRIREYPQLDTRPQNI
jgi:hypothetical protein